MGERAAIRPAVRLALIIAGGYLAARYLLGWTAPFIVAFILAACMEPAVSRLCRCGWRRGMASGYMTMAVVIVLLCALAALLSRAAHAAGDLARELPEVIGQVESAFGELKARVAAPAQENVYLQAAAESVARSARELPQKASGYLLEKAAQAASLGPDILLFAVTSGIGAYFISAAFPRIKKALARYLPEDGSELLNRAGRDLAGTLGGWFRAQLILLAITFGELLAAFWLLKIPNAAVIALVTAAVDALPVFGTGTVLIPWGAYTLITGDMALGAGLLVTYGAVTLVRNCIQAKLLGDQIGLDPILSLLAMYIGWRVWGVWGMLCFPVLAVTLRQLNKNGIIRLWPAEKGEETA